MERGHLYFTVGLPQSGKSTRCDYWATHPDIAYTYEGMGADQPTINRPRAIISGDDFRTSLYGRSYQIEAEGTVFAMMDVAARALLNRGFDVVIDETSTTEATLLRYLRLDINATPVFVDTEVDTCIERAQQNGKSYLIGPIRRMAAQLAKLRAYWGSTVERLQEYLRSRESQDIAC